MKIGFLFNHDQIHQVAHSLPIALALARIDVDAEIIVATTNDRVAAEVLRLCEGDTGRIRFVRLELESRHSRILARALGNLVPASKLLVYRDNLDFFRSLDVLVVAEKTSLILKTRYGLDLKIVHTRHGAGDRAIGFDAASALFDHVLVSGPKIRDRLIAEAKVDPASISIVGYPKFDAAPSEPVSDTLSKDGRAVVLYNPHVSPDLSSWYRMGRQVLDWFVGHDEYQLIFAPHVMLFERSFALSLDRWRVDRPGRLEDRYLNVPNIHVDLGSRASTTMAYTNRADIYLGDVSSQFYEFIARPRPCVFIDAHHTDWQRDANYAHWAAGPVIRSPSELGPALKDAVARQESEFRAVQEALFRYSIDLDSEQSAVRAARALASVAGLA